MFKKGQLTITVEAQTNSSLLNKSSVAHQGRKFVHNGYIMDLFSHLKVTILTYTRKISAVYTHFVNNGLYCNYNTLSKMTQ